MKLPDKVMIVGCEYSVSYEETPSDVDIRKCDSLWGQIDYWTRSIRVFKRDRANRDIFETLMHEILHGVVSRLKLKALDDNEDCIQLLAVGLTDVLCDNHFIELEG
jgi:hypothetical protein